MKILVVGGMYPPMRTGTAFYTRNVAQVLQARGHKVEVVTLGKRISVEREDGLTVHRLPAFKLPMAGFFKHFQISSLNPLNWARLNRIVRDVKPDVIFLVNHYLDIAFLTEAAAKLNKVPLICSVGTQLQSLNPRRDRILNMLDRMICGNLVFPFCARIIAWDKQIEQYLVDVQGEGIRRKIAIVNYGVNGGSESFSQPRTDFALRDVILAVGAVSEQRSFVPLVRAFAKLTENYPNLRLRVAGHVYFDEAIQVAAQLNISERVTFLGEIPHASVLDEMRRADVLYASLTGKYVGLGTAPIEAMLLGVPTVVNVPTDLLGGPQLIDGMHFVQCMSLDENDIAARLEGLLADQLMRETVGQGGCAFVKEHLNWNVVATGLEGVFESVTTQSAVSGG